MTKTTKIIWRLKEQPSAENLRELVKDGILSKDEARKILFNETEAEERDSESFKQEIKFLRDLVEKLSLSQSKTVEVIRTYEKPYIQYPWYGSYNAWCGGSFTSNLQTNTANTLTSQNYQANSLNQTGTSFSSINTF